MLIKPRLADHKVVGFYLGTIMCGIGCAMLVPALTAACFREWPPFFDYILSSAVALSLGLFLRIICFTKKEIDWLHGMTIAALSWLAAAAVAALPFYFGRISASYFDAFFEAMSAFSTTGFSLVLDLDHLAVAHNMWRHLMMFLGGQGIVVIALSLLVHGGAGGFKLYAGEAREERILPNVLNTARFIWLVSSVFLVIGTAVLTVILKFGGLSWCKAFLHGLWLFISSFDTGGFAPHSQNILYYHSWPLELALLFVIIFGMFNFRLHYVVWTGDRRELWRDIELGVLFWTILAAFSVIAFALIQARVYPNIIAVFRKGFFLLLSGHATAGYNTLYAGQMLREWGHPALLALILAMSIGGSICSTTGAIKALRLGILYKALCQDVRRLLLPDTAVVMERFRHIRDVFLQDKMVRSVALVTLLYIAAYLFGAFVGVCYGYPFFSALFESVSAASNSGLSVGILSPELPFGLKLVYFLQIWAGRLEFTAVFALLAYFYACWRGK